MTLVTHDVHLFGTFLASTVKVEFEVFFDESSLSKSWERNIYNSRVPVQDIEEPNEKNLPCSEKNYSYYTTTIFFLESRIAKVN